MATYVLPQTLVFQEFNLIPQADVRPLPAHIAGGHAYLLRYADEDEKPLGRLGYYDSLTDTCYSWPERPTGATIDEDYTKVYIDNALLRYFEDTIGSDDNIETVAGEPNQVRADSISFKENGDDFPRSAVLQERDVAVGDAVKIRAVVGADVYTLWTYVAGFVAEVVAAVVAAATTDTDNPATQILATTNTGQTAGPVNCVEISAVSAASYDGLADGDISETYTITVIESSAGEDATTAKLRVTSASGNDDVAEVTPAAFGAPTAIGTRGLTVTFSQAAGEDCSLSASLNDVANNDFIAGQEFEVSCDQAFTKPVPTSGGTYSGDVDVTYIIEVTRGGEYTDTDKPQITVTTDKGVDVSGPTNVTAAATAVAAGTKGVTVQFSGTALRKGDRYFISVTAEQEGAMQTLVLGHNLPEEVQDNGATAVDLSLYIRKNIQVDKNRVGFAPVVNWTQSDTELCLESGLVAYDDTWTDGGVPEALPVISEESQDYGVLYVEYRAWRTDLCNEVNSIHDVGELDDAISGPLHPDNELKYGVFKALQNSNGVPVKYTSVCDPSDTDEWLRVLEILDGRDDVYGLVPLTRNPTVWSAYQAHVGSQSAATMGRWRVAWLSLPGVLEKVVVDATLSSDDEEVLATLTDDPLTSGTQYTLLKVPARNGKFVANEVRAGDIVRGLYTTDGFGNSTYTEFVVDAVVNEDTLRLLVGHSAAINVPQKIEIWRNLTATEQAQEIALTHGFSDRRVRAVWPDEIGSDGFTVAGYFLTAALAGLTSGVAPHQGLTRLEIAGFDSVTRSTISFNRSQLDIMAGGGVWIVTQDLQDGSVFTRHAVTTAEYDNINEREEMITRNVDSISYYFLDLFDPYIGISNVTDSTLAILRAETRSGIKFLQSSNFVARLGSQLGPNTEILELRAHSTLKDRIVLSVSLDVPYALNNLEVHLVV